MADNQKDKTHEDKKEKPPKKQVAQPSNIDHCPDNLGAHSGFMFSFDDQSPQSSPRDPPGEATNQESPSSSPRPKKVYRGPGEFLTQSSPPKFVSFEEIMKAADGVTNMTLAHEISVDNDFRFQKLKPAENSIEKQVQDVMHRAFWDALQEKLREDPPDYSHALVLLQEVREIVLDLMLPYHQRLRTQIEEVLDMELIEQQADKGALDVQYYADFVISIMAKLCAPVRDEQIEKLKENKDIVPLFKSIFEMLDILKLDMANFTIQQIRPYLQSQSVDYEKTKFQQLLKQQEENGQDGLKFTRSWLQRAGDKMSQEVLSQTMVASPSQSSASGASSASTSTSLSPAAILNIAYLELLQWPDNIAFPETLLMDQKRFLDLREKAQWLALVSSVLMVTYNMVGNPISGVKLFKEKLKNDIAAIIDGVPFEKVKEVMPNVGQQVIKEVQSCLKEHGYQQLLVDKAVLLQGLIEGVASPDQAVHKCLRERLMTNIRQLISRPGSKEIQVPPGFAAMSDEFSHVYGQFLRLISHNRTVFGLYYADILSTYLKIKSGDEAPNEAKPS